MEVKCSKCKIKFLGTTDFLNHFFARHSLLLNPEKRNILNFKSAAPFSPIRSDCEICGQQIVEKSLGKHIESHIGAMPFFCDLCHFPTISSLMLRLHKRSHHKESPRLELLDLHQCDICNSFFKTLNGLMTHYMSHLKRMPFSCGICKMMFQKKIDLVVHSHLHGKAKHCFICAKIFIYRAQLLTHVLAHRKSLFFQNFRIRLENGQLLTSFPKNSSYLPPQKTPVGVESLCDFELETSPLRGIRTDLKLRTSDGIESLSNLKSRTSDAIESRSILKSRTSDAIRIRSIFKSRTSDAIESRSISELRTSDAIETQSIYQSKIADVIKICSPGASGVFGNENNPRLKTVIENENNFKPRNSVLVKKKNEQPRNSDAIDFNKLKTRIDRQDDPNLRTSDIIKSKSLRTADVVQSRGNLKLRTADVVENRNKLKLRNLDDVEDGNDCISNVNFALTGCSTYRGKEQASEVWKTSIKKEPDIEYQQDIDYLCDVVMEEKQFDLEHFISNTSKDTRSSNQIFEKSMQRNGGPSNIYFCNTVRIEEDAEFISKEDNTHTNENQMKKFQTISLQDNFDLVSPLPLAVATLPELQSKTFDSSCVFGSSTRHKTQPKSKSKRCLKKIDISIEEPEVQHNSLETDVVPNNRSNLQTFKKKKSKVQFFVNSNRSMVGTSKHKDSIPTTINNSGGEISNKIIGHSQPQFETDIRKTIPTYIQSEQSDKRSRPQFGRNKVRKSTHDRLISRKIYLRSKSQIRTAIRKASPICNESRQVCAMSELQLKSNLDKSISNGLEPQMPCLRSRSRLPTGPSETAKSCSEPRQVHTRTRPQLRKDSCKATTKCAEAQNLDFKELSVLLHKLPSYVLGMRSYRKYCRIQKIEMLREKNLGRSTQNMGEISLQEKGEAGSRKGRKCPTKVLQNDLIKEKNLEIDNSRNSSSFFLNTRSPNSMLSTSKQFCDAYVKKDTSITTDLNSTGNIAALKEKHKYSSKITKTFSNKMYVSSPYKIIKKKSKFHGNRWGRSRRKTTKASVKIKCSLPHLQENSRKENYFFSDSDQLTRNDSSIYSDSGAPSCALSSGNFCEISRNENVSITRAVDANSTSKTVLLKEDLCRSRKNSRKKNIFSKSYPKRNGNVTQKMLSKNKEVKSINGSIRSSPRFSSLSIKLCFTDNEHSGNTHTKDGFNIKQRRDTRNSKKTHQKDKQDNICSIAEKQALPCQPVSNNRNGQLIMHNTHAFQSTSYEQRSIKHQTSKEFTPTLTILDASVELERLPDGVCDMPSYKEFCNKKSDKMFGMEDQDSGLEDQSVLNKPESVYCEPHANARSLFKQKCAISQNQNEKISIKTNFNKNSVFSFQPVKRTNVFARNSMQKKAKLYAKKCVSDFINENAMDEFYDSEETETAPSNGEFSSSDESSLDSSNHFSNKIKFYKSRRELFPRFTNSLKNYQLDSSKNSEGCSNSQPKSSSVLTSSNIPQRWFNRITNAATITSNKSAPIPFKYWAMNGPSIAKTYSSTIIKPKLIKPNTSKNVLNPENGNTPQFGSLNIHKRTKKCVKKPAPKPGKANIIKLSSNHRILGIKSSGESAIHFDKPKQIRNILYGKNKGIHCIHPHTKIESYKVWRVCKRPLQNCIMTKKVKGEKKVKKHSSRIKRSLQRKPKNISVCFSRPIDLDVKLRRLPACIYEKYTKGKPIMLSSLLPIVENVRSIHCELKMTHQITIEHSYCVRYLNSSSLIRYEHSYSSRSATI